jgi:hypothetical protein
MKPEREEYPEWAESYINKTPDRNIVEIIENQLKDVAAFFNDIPEEKELYRYEDGKWSIKEILGHINDTERMLTYRMLRFLRGDKTNIEQYDHIGYVCLGNFDEIDFQDLKKEFRFLRKATIMMVNNIKDDQWKFEGYAGGKAYTLRALAYIIVGHINHHMKVIEERYL